MKVIIQNGTLVFKNAQIEYERGTLTLENKGITYSDGNYNPTSNTARLRNVNKVLVRAGMTLTLSGLVKNEKILTFFYWLYESDGTAVKGYFGGHDNYFTYNYNELSNECTITNENDKDYYVGFCFKDINGEEILASEFNITYKSRIS